MFLCAHRMTVREDGEDEEDEEDEEETNQPNKNFNIESVRSHYLTFN